MNFKAKVFFSKNYEDAKIKAKIFLKKIIFFFSNGCNKNIFLGNSSMFLDAIDEIKKRDKEITKKSISNFTRWKWKFSCTVIYYTEKCIIKCRHRMC